MSKDKIEPPFPGVQSFLFEAPLYTKFKLSEDLKDVEILYGRVKSPLGRWTKGTVDGFCPFCEQSSTFRVDGISIPNGDPWNNVHIRWAYDDFKVTCTRDETHELKYFVLIKKLVIQKVGQNPSLADIAIDETRQKYRSVLKGDNWSEFYKAIGLAAHGEGIGSFVYLRRVFERLIQSRFHEFKEAEGWDEDDFRKLRMDGRVQLLKNHLPSFLHDNRKIYSIFSKGIHELENEACLTFFNIGKRSIIMILEDDLKHKEDMQAREELKQAIAQFDGTA